MNNPLKCNVFDSFLDHELTSEKENEVKSQMKRIKSPYLIKIQEAKQHFKDTKKFFEQKQMNKCDQKIQVFYKEKLQDTHSACNQSTDRHPIKNQRAFTEESNDDEIYNQERLPNFREWKLEHHQNAFFDKKTDLIDNYNEFFENKLKSSKIQAKGQSFKIEQKLIIQKIYSEIGDTQSQTVSFAALIDFFEKCPLFYHIYNIHPNSLVNVIKQSAHKQQNKLTVQQFMNLFLLNNRTNYDYQNYNIEKVEKKCVLDEQTWKDLKEVFTVFDTFGNETIQLRQFMQKLKISLPLKYLLEKEVMNFPSINRCYKLKKIIFQIEHKMKIIDTFIRWQEIKNLIMNFNHIKQPSIDIIQRKHLSAGKINHFSNTFMIKDEIIDFIKQAFNRSPKYCQNFVNLSNLCDQMYDSTQCKNYLPEIVRDNPQRVTFGQALLKLKACEYQYLDLDQILQWFSIKDISKEAEKALMSKFSQFESSQSDDEEFNKKRKQACKKNKNIHNLPTKYVPICGHKQITKIEQFNFTKNKNTTIRERKVQQMIKQKQQRQKRQYQKKFKANAIPSSTNNEKYLEYTQKMRKNKEVFLSKLNHVNQRDLLVLKHLEANTKLFQKHTKIQVQEQKYVFQSKPIPWFVQLNLLEKIEQDKKQRIKQKRRQIKLKYLRQWKNLPAFLQEMNIKSQVGINKEASEQIILIQLDSKLKKSIKQVPNFKELQKKFQEQLQKRKNNLKQTVIKQFNLTSPKQSKKISEIIPKQTFSSITKKSHIKESNNYIGSTIKYQAIVKLNQQKKEAQWLKKQEQKQANKERKQNQKQFARYMRKQLLKQFKMMDSGQKKKMGRRKRKQFEKKHQKEIGEIYRRVFMRPFLFQTKSNHNKPSAFLESRARPVQLNEESPNNIYEIVSDLGQKQHVEVEIKNTESEQGNFINRNSY